MRAPRDGFWGEKATCVPVLTHPQRPLSLLLPQGKGRQEESGIKGQNDQFWLERAIPNLMIPWRHLRGEESGRGRSARRWQQGGITPEVVLDPNKRRSHGKALIKADFALMEASKNYPRTC